MNQRKIILFGKTGDGKSSAGNTILRKEGFNPKASASSVTEKCASEEGMIDERQITVIDTPRFFDTSRSDEEIKSEIMKGLTECAPSIDAFVMVLKVARYTTQEKEVFQQFLNILEEGALKHTVILFTFGEQLEGQSIEDYVKTSPELQELVDKCGGRCHVIDNTYWTNCDSEDKSNRVQVKKLMETIDKMVEENGCYSNELLQKVEEDIQEEMKISKVDREEAKKTVHTKLMKQLVGAVTGALIGALLGVGVAVALVLTLKGNSKVTPRVTARKHVVAVLGVAAIAGAVGGGITGWSVAEDADSLCDAMKKALLTMRTQKVQLKKQKNL